MFAPTQSRNNRAQRSGGKGGWSTIAEVAVINRVGFQDPLSLSLRLEVSRISTAIGKEIESKERRELALATLDIPWVASDGLRVEALSTGN